MAKLIINEPGKQKKYIKRFNRVLQTLEFTTDPEQALESDEGQVLDEWECDNIKFLFLEQYPELEYLEPDFDEYEEELQGDPVNLDEDDDLEEYDPWS